MLTSFLRPDAPNTSGKSDDELRDCIDNRENLLPESVLAAVTELQRRKVDFSEEEIKVIQEDMQARTEIAASSKIGYGSLFNDGYKKCLVEDPDAYAFYSKRAIKGFTFFCGAFFGSILMAINIWKTKNQLGVLLVLLFGIGLTVVEIGIAENAHLGTSSNIFFAFLNTAMIEFLFWNIYIGKNALYRARTYWTPLTIAIILGILFIAAMFYARG